MVVLTVHLIRCAGLCAGVAEADSVVLVVDGQAGLHPSDEEVLTWLRQNHPSKPVVLAVNKCESVTKGEMQVSGWRAWCARSCAAMPVSSTRGTQHTQP
jgi:GTP-binding protein